MTAQTNPCGGRAEVIARDREGYNIAVDCSECGRLREGTAWDSLDLDELARRHNLASVTVLDDDEWCERHGQPHGEHCPWTVPTYDDGGDRCVLLLDHDGPHDLGYAEGN